MNRTLIAIISFSIFLISSCSPDSSPSQVQIPGNSIELEWNRKDIDYTINEFALKVTSNCQWHIICPENWINILSPQDYYTGSALIRFRVEKNTATSERQGSVVFTDGKDTTRLNIIQGAFEVYLHSDETVIDCGYRAAEKIIRISSNCGWYANADMEWIAIKPSTGLIGNYDMQLNIETNTTPQARTGKVHIRNDEYDQDIYIVINQAEGIDRTAKPYIDEYGIDRGHGIQIDELIWAPVNCGFNERTHRFGKLYQWGRRRGLGYADSHLADSSVTIISEIWTGTNGDEAEDTYYKYSTESKYGYDWLLSGNHNFWNLGTEENPIKNTEYDPCPEGWRTPTRFEFRQLIERAGRSWTELEGQTGYIFYNSENNPEKLFLPAGGRLNVSDGMSYDRNIEGYYWTNTTSDNGSSSYLYFYNENCSMNNQGSRAGGCLVRCVWE